jgi:predicted RNase H-like nuclease
MYDEARDFSRKSAVDGGAISKQTWAIVPKIRKVDDLLRKHPVLREMTANCAERAH